MTLAPSARLNSPACTATRTPIRFRSFELINNVSIGGYAALHHRLKGDIFNESTWGHFQRVATRELTLDLRLFKGPVTARWFNPTDGRYTAIAGSPFYNRQPQRLTTPGDNGTGDNDWLLIMECLGE